MLQSVTPLGSSTALSINIIGTGLNATAANNRVTFSMAGAGSQTVNASLVTTIDATRRRLVVIVPRQLPSGRAAVSVTNTATGGVASGVSIDVLELFTPQPAAAPPGATGLRVALTASSNTNFVAGLTTASFGTGITVRTIEVVSPTQLVATIDVAANATLGTRTVRAQTNNQVLQTANAFAVQTSPANQAPSANANGPYNGTSGAPITFTSKGSSDPDGDPLTFAWTFGDGASSTDANPSHTYAAPGTFNVSLTVNDGKGGTATSTTTAVITQANRPPQITSSPVLTATVGQPYGYQVTAADLDNDSLTFSLPTAASGMTIGASGLIAWTPTANQTGPQTAQVQVADGRGGTDVQSFTVQVSPAPVVLSGIEVTPATIRFAEADATRALAVVGTRSDGSTIDVTAAAAGTTYSSSHPFIASVSTGGVVTAHGNGEAVISVANGGFTDFVGVVVEVGVALEALELTPASATLRLAGATQQLVLKGTFSDGSARDLTASPATSFGSSLPSAATVSVGGLVTAVTNGDVTITATHGDLQAQAALVVSIPDGAGFVHGAVFDDSRGLPLAGATVALVSDGSGAVTSSVVTTADERGRYAIPAQAGDVVLRIRKPGFTTVDRAVTLPSGGVARALDARLTPVDTRANALLSAFGGQARDERGATSLTIPPGALAADADLRLTPISAQGLAGRLPYGWSPVGVIDIGPDETVFAQPATLVLSNTGGVPAASSVTIARYDRARRAWIALAQVLVSGDGRTITLPALTGGQFAALSPDVTPNTPPAPQPGQPLAGVDAVALPADVTADGEVLPRSAPPGEAARAVGRIGLQSPAPLPSGSVLRVAVNESFDLLDATTVVPLPFGQDILVHARPRPPDGGSLGASFPITPSKNYSIQELMRGVVHLDVERPSAEDGARAAGPQGAVIAGTEGETLTIPAGALSGETLVEIRRVAAAAATAIPQSFESVGGIEIEIIGAALALPGQLSIPVPAGLTAADQVLLVQAFIDRLGVRRLRIAGIGRVQGDRLSGDTALDTLQFPGVTSGGQYFFLKAPTPFGFVTGVVTAADGMTPAPDVLLTSSTAPFVDVTGATGRYIVAAAAGTGATILGRHLVTADSTAGSAQPAGRDAIVTLPLTLALAPPRVIAIAPAGGTTDVALDTSVTIDFSEAIDPVTISESSVSLQTGGAPVPASRVLSQDRRRLTVRPAAPLAGKTTYTVVLTAALADLSGVPLVPFVPSVFTTLDPTKPPPPPSGQITGSLPDDDGVILVVGTSGAADAGVPVTATNTRTQETFTVLALGDGSFRLRISGVVGDEVVLTFRSATGADTTVPLLQLTGADGVVGIGGGGGTILGAGGQIGTVLPRALSTAGTFQILAADATQPLPALGGTLSYVDRFDLRIEGASFNTLRSLTLTESQGRFAPAVATAVPFAAAGAVVVPADFLLNNSVRISAVVQDATGLRRSLSASTVIVAGDPDVQQRELAQASDFPALYLSAPREATPNQLVSARAVAPSARVDLKLPFAGPVREWVLLGRVIEVGGSHRLSVVDRLESDGLGHLRTSGRELPGMSRSGRYVAVDSSEDLVFITGQLVGAPGIVVVDDLPLAFETEAPNGRFSIPVRAAAPFTLRLLNADGSSRGTVTGQAPATGMLDVGDPLGTSAGQLLVTVAPDADSIADIDSPLAFRFSEPVDLTSVNTGVLVTAPNGTRVFGRFARSEDGSLVLFTPSRRWRYGTTYRYSISTSVLSLTGARLLQPVSGQFTTFRPAVFSTLPIPDVRSVAVRGDLGVVATPEGITALDVSAPRSMRAVASLAIPGGAGAVTLVDPGPLPDRNGSPIPTPVALVASGGGANAAELLSIGLALPTLDRLGRTQLTTAEGQAPPVGVPAITGTPAGVAALPDGRTFVALEAGGIASVRYASAIPTSTNAAEGLGPRYPDVPEIVSDVAVLGERVYGVGTAGVSVLDAQALGRLGGIATDGAPQGVAAVADFLTDLNGDGVVDPLQERFDLVAVANGADGTLQIYRSSPDGALLLLSVIRLNGTARTVAVDRTERLAYVGVAGQGVALVDLDGPASVQPLDVDRDGRDDRILYLAATGGAARRIALDLDRGLGFVADGPGGLTVLQLLPPRIRLRTLQRDPVLGLAGDEQSILTSRVALTTDDALLAGIEVILPPGDVARVFVEETSPQPDRQLALIGSSAVAELSTGLHQVAVGIAPGALPLEGRLVITDASRTFRLAIDFALVAPGPPPAGLETLLVSPDPLVIGADQASGAIAVSGRYADGQVRNLTRDPLTLYETTDPAVATVDADGVVRPVAGGTAGILVSHGTQRAEVSVVVQRPAVLVELIPETTPLTLTATEARGANVVARFSDRSTRPASELPGTTWETSDPSVVTVDAAGVLTAHRDGVATVRVRNGALSATLSLAVELRVRPSLSAIQLAPQQSPASLDDPALLVAATVTGTGALEGLLVTITSPGQPGISGSGRTGYDGATQIPVRGFAAGVLDLVASVVDPTTAAVLSDTETFTVTAGTQDLEPNSELAFASVLAPERTVEGTLTAGSDGVDVYRLDPLAAGELTLQLSLAPGTSPTAVQLVVLSESGQELGRFTPQTLTESFSLTLPPGAAFVRLELAGASARYQLAGTVEPGPLSITAVQPGSGGPGTSVRVTGSGFSPLPSENEVLFGGVRSRIVAATATTLDVIVPAMAVNGPLTISSLGRDLTGPVFVTGNAGPLPAAQIAESSPGDYRRSPQTGQLVDITRLRVVFDPGVTPAQVQQIAAALGGAVVGTLPRINGYYLRFGGNASFAGLAQLEASLRSRSDVEVVTSVAKIRTHSGQIDLRDRSGRWPRRNGTPDSQSSELRSAAYEQMLLFEAIAAIRNNSQFADATNLKPVKIAVIDTGFKPKLFGEFSPDGTCSGARSLVRSYKEVVKGALAESPCFDLDGHGTEVTGIIAALNDDSTFSGILGSLFRRDEVERALEKLAIYSYGCDKDGLGIDVGCQDLAFDDIAAQGIEVANLSFGENYVGAGLLSDQRWYRRQIRATAGRTLFVASAGNEGLDASASSPSSLTSDADGRVISVGAVATQDRDQTGETWDARAVYGTDPRPLQAGLVNCDNAKPVNGSNCGLIDVVAPGDDVATTGISPLAYSQFGGTSAAAPMVTGVAALLQMIRPSAAALPAREIKKALRETGDELQAVWTPGFARRLNALAAVRRLLPLRPAPRAWVAHRRGAAAWVLAGFMVDPLDGFDPAAAAVEIRLEATLEGAPVAATRVLAMQSSPVDGRLYVLAQTDAPIGAGVFVVNPAARRVNSFVPLSSDPATPVHLPAGQQGIAFSADYRLLFVPRNAGIAVVDTRAESLVKVLDQLPGSLRAQAIALPANALETKLQSVDQRLSSVAGGVPVQVRDLTVSPDGQTLFILVNTGGGPGNNPGYVVPVSIALLVDLNPASFAVEPPLADFMAPLPRSFRMTTPTNDEPAAVRVGADGKHLYVVNGGVESFVPVFNFTSQQLNKLALEAVQGGTASTQAQIDTIEATIRRDLQDGFTSVVAPGNAGVFDLDPSAAGDPALPVWHYPNNVVFGWNPATDRIVSQFRRAEVFAKRPFGFGLRPDGRRALLPFFQTGNFGVLDLDFQRGLTSPVISDLRTFFQALVAVTPSLKLDEHMVPSTGRVGTVPSPDVSLLFPGPIAYAQNGRYAAAAHVGSGSAQEYLLPDGTRELRGGGAISFIDDRAITQDLQANISLPDGAGDFFFSSQPLCRSRDDAGRCADGVLVSQTGYSALGSTVRFERPSAVAFEPVLLLEAPASGSNARLGTSLNLSWNDGRVVRVVFNVTDLGTRAAPATSAAASAREPILSPQDRSRRTFAIAFGRLFTSPEPIDKHVYRIRVDLLDGAGNLIGQATTEVVFFK